MSTAGLIAKGWFALIEARQQTQLAERDLRLGPLEPEAEQELVTNCHVARDALIDDVAWDPPEALAHVERRVLEFAGIGG